jgi:hypothetical protein
MLNGYKSYIGATLIGLGAAAAALGYPDLAALVTRLGEAIGLMGVAHKLAKAQRAV